jgi:CoA:oxalate CoA-transferase
MLPTPPPGPLDGLTVLDLSRVLAGPYCTMLLADLGATVIKVEHPEGGDEARGFLPFIGGQSAYFAAVNRGKQSIALDLGQAEDRAIFERLLARADVLVENFRPGVMDRLGYGGATLLARWPRLVVASISGFGQHGPYRERGAYDLIVQAMSGLISLTGHPGQPPVRAGTSFGDLAASVFAANGIQAALLRRVRTGCGGLVDVAMFDCQVALLENAIARFQASGEVPQPMGARHSGTAPFDAFQAADGWLVITAGGDALFQRLATVLERPAWCDDPRFAGRAPRVEHQAALKALIEERLATAPVAHWLALLQAAGVPAGPIQDIAQLMADPQLAHRGLLAPVDGLALHAAHTPIRFDEQPWPTTLPAAPALDQHRADVLRLIEGDPER